MLNKLTTRRTGFEMVYMYVILSIQNFASSITTRTPVCHVLVLIVNVGLRRFLSNTVMCNRCSASGNYADNDMVV